MPIISSVLHRDSHVQKDGSRWCKEVHTDSEGRVQHILYRQTPGQDEEAATATMNNRVAYLDEQLAEAEVEAILGA